MPRRAATVFSEERLIVSLPYESAAARLALGGGVAFRLPPGGGSRGAGGGACGSWRAKSHRQSGFDIRVLPRCGAGYRSAYGVNRSPLPEGGLLHGEFGLDPTAMRSPCGLRLAPLAQDDT